MGRTSLSPSPELGESLLIQEDHWVVQGTGMAVVTWSNGVVVVSVCNGSTVNLGRFGNSLH